MKKNFLIILISCFIGFVLLLSGCSGSKEAAAPTNQETASKQAESSQPGTSPQEKETPSSETPAAVPEETATKGSPSANGEPVDTLGDRLTKTYNDLFTSGKYFMKYRMNTEGETIIAEIAYDGDNFAVKTEAAGMETHMILKDNKLYLIDHQEKTFMVTSSDYYEPETEEVDYAGLVFLKAGQGDFLGQTLPYEEYSSEGSTIKYFFKGTELVGMEMNLDGQVQVMEILELGKNIPSGMFDVPQNYTRQSMG